MDINTYENFWIGFISNAGIKYINPATGKYRSEPPMNGLYFRMILGKKEETVTIVFEDNKNNLVVSSGVVEIKNLKLLGKPTPLSSVNTYVFDKNKNITEKEIAVETDELFRGRVVGEFSKILHSVKNVFGQTMYISQDGTCVNIKDETDLETFLSFKEESKQNNAEQKMLDELVRQTPDVTKVNYFFHEKGCDKVSTIERINHNIPCCCLRNFTYLNNTVNVLETMRIYIFKDKIVSAKRNNNNEYIFSTLEKLEAWNCSLDYISPEVGKGTKLEYFTSIVNELIPSYRPRLLFLCINFPAFESLYKSGYRNIASAILENNSIEEIFNEITPNQNNLYKVFGINKYQFDKLNKELSSFGELVLIKPDGCDKSNINMSKNEYKNILSKVKNTNFNIIKNIKTLLNSNNISNLDNETFDFLFEICHNNYIINIAKLYIEIYGLSSFFDKKDFWIYWYNVSKSSFFYNYNNLFIDTLTMIKDMNLQNNIKVNWMSTNSMVEAHDFIQSAYETEINALKIKKFTNNCKKLEKYKFANSKYIIVVPTVPNQLAIEGIELHHCVKSYINKVVDGITGIVFIREKENIDKPFFTVEIQNDTVMQIHGFSNCNVTESSLKTFVKKWITIKNLKENPDGFNIVR